MQSVAKTKVPTIILGPFLKFRKMWEKVRLKTTSKGINGGYILKLPTISPSKRSENDL